MIDRTYFVNAEGREAFFAQQLNRILDEIDSRLKDLEFKTSKVKRKTELSRAETMALLNETGILDAILGLGIPQKKIATILSEALAFDATNIEKDLSQRGQDDAPFKTLKPYQYAVNKLTELGLKEPLAKAQKTLNRLEDLKDAKK